MSVFSGVIEATFDEKGRVVLPSDFKNLLGGSVPGGQLAIQLDKYEKCLNVYSMREWEKLVTKVRSKLNLNNPKHSKMLDSFLRKCRVIAVPENCRFTVPAHFLTSVGIVKQVVFTGQCERMRIWDVVEYEKYNETLDEVEDDLDLIIGGEEPDV